MLTSQYNSTRHFSVKERAKSCLVAFVRKQWVLCVYFNIRLWTGEPVDMGLFCLGNWAKVKWEESVRFLFRAHRAANRVSEGAWHGETHEKQGLNETWSLGCFSGMWRNSSNLLSYTALLRSLGTWFSHWLIVTKKILHTGVCWPFLSNHLKWDNPGGIHIVWNAKNRNCRFWRTYTLAHGINPRCRWWTADHQGGSDNNVIAIWNTRSQKKKKRFCLICMELISRSEGKHLSSSKGNGKVPAETTGTAKKVFKT